MQELLDVLQHRWTDLLARPGGPYGFRFVLQPLMAALLAVALLLALVPYLLLRGPVDRLARRWRASRTSQHAAPGSPPRGRTT